MSAKEPAARYWVRSPEGRAIFGLRRLEAAVTAALEMPVGSHLIDTEAQAYFPVLQEVALAPDGKKVLLYGPIGGWDSGRHGAAYDLVEAVKTGHPAIVHAHLAKGAPADARDAKGGPALHWAAARGDGAIVELLLRHGAAPDARDAKNQTAADVAAARGKDQVAALLRSKIAG